MVAEVSLCEEALMTAHAHGAGDRTGSESPRVLCSACHRSGAGTQSFSPSPLLNTSSATGTGSPGWPETQTPGQGSCSPEDHRQLSPSQPVHKYCASSRAEHPERLMLLSSSLESLGEAQEGHQLAPANRDHSHAAMKGHARRVNPLWMNALMVNTSCRTIPCTCRQCAGLLRGPQGMSTPPTTC